MTIRRLQDWTLRRRRGRRAQEAEAVVFQRVRVHLTLWYCGVLGAALVLFGVALYLGTQQALLNPIQAKTQAAAQMHSSLWNNNPSGGNGCQAFGPYGPPDQNQGFSMEMVLCFDTQGSLLPGQNTTGLPAVFLTNPAVRAALHSSTGKANATVNAGGEIGTIYCYAQVVTNAPGHGGQGVILVGEDIQPEEDALSSLMTLLLGIGGIALLGAGLGGLFLANRALAPARLAWNNQQRFIGDAAHELRTPLTLLHADAEVLLRGRERMEAEDAYLLEDIVTETEHMASITTNLLTLARLDSSSSHREHEVVNLAELAQEGVRRVQALAERQDITVQFHQTGKPVVIGDPLLLEQALLVLLHNAIKYNRQAGKVHVQAIARDRYALLQVDDTGIGIAAEHLPYLGQRFYRVDQARSREAGGTGLGLSIARSIAIAHDGQLTVNSLPNQGTTVILTFPLAQDESTKQAVY